MHLEAAGIDKEMGATYFLLAQIYDTAVSSGVASALARIEGQRATLEICLAKRVIPKPFSMSH